MENMVNNLKILIVGNLGYIGPVLVKYLRNQHPEAYLAGYDIGYFTQNYTHEGFVGESYLNVQYYGDVRQFNAQLLKGFDAVVYLAAISNDPMGNVFEKPTHEINHAAAINIAKMAKAGGVRSFVFASSCSVYGFADTAPRKEDSELNPLTAYAKSKVMTERDLAPIADESFTVTCLRFATACGYSDRLRLDLVLNDFVACAIVDKKITILSDGSPWRPLIHVNDMSRAIDWAVQRKNNDYFLIVNTGSNEWNYQIKELALAVQKQFHDVEISVNSNAQPDKRSYMVNFDLFKKLAPDFQPQVSLEAAITGLKNGLSSINFNDSNFRQSKLIRLKTIQNLVSNELIDNNLSKTGKIQL